MHVSSIALSSLALVQLCTSNVIRSAVAKHFSLSYEGGDVATTVNGSYQGVHSEEYNQYHFLGIPFAQPPLGDLRFRSPVSLNSTWAGTRNATAYSPIVSELLS